jgi:hypothetical protein
MAETVERRIDCARMLLVSFEVVTVCMLTKLNIASWGLLIGAIGQFVLYGTLGAHFPSRVFFIATFPPG